MIDTHAHLDQIFCDIDRGLDKIILAAANLETSKNNLLLAQKYPNILLASVGIHPQELDNSPVELKKIVEQNYEKIVAIGECGMDFSEISKESPKFKEMVKIQEKIFRAQIELSQKYNKPLIVHARRAVDETVEILKEYKDLSGVFHCYAGGNKRIKKVVDLGLNWFFGIDGNLTYEIGLAEVVKNIPMERLVIETDSPYLTPVPFKGEVNSPKNVIYIYEKVAEIWGKSFKETEKIIDGNAKRLFKFV